MCVLFVLVICVRYNSIVLFYVFDVLRWHACGIVFVCAGRAFDMFNSVALCI